MTTVGRWEWRTFGAGFGDAEARLAAQPADRVEDSAEEYLVSLASDASIKVRAGQVDVKRLMRVDEDQVEQWVPILKAPFPLSAADAATVLRAAGVDGSADTADTLSELVGTSSQLRAVPIRKHRVHCTFAGCMAEVTELRVDASITRTLVIESEDRERVVAAVRALGLDARRNTCVARGLKALTGFGARRFAVIDTGTNSVKFHLAERRADGTWTTIVDRAEVTRLGEGLDHTGRLDAGAMERTATAIAEMVDEARNAGADVIAAVGTAGLRIAGNGSDLVAAVRARTGVEIEILSGEDEARLAYVAATTALGPTAGSRVVFDTGGGSSQFTFGGDDHVAERFSLNVGAVRFTERYGLSEPVPRTTLAELQAAIAAELERLAGRPAPATIVGMGGAVTNLAAVSRELAVYDPDVVHGTVLDRVEIDRQIELYRGLDARRRHAIIGLQPNRAEVILAGACIVRAVLMLLGRETLTVSDRGLRHGLLAERFALGVPATL